MSLLAELKHRNVFRIAILYAVSSWLLLQVGDVLFGLLGVPDWSLRLLLGILILGLPLVLVFAWIYELTPDGLKKGSPVDRRTSAEIDGKINRVISVVLAVAVLILLVDRWREDQSTSEPLPGTAAAPGSQTQEQALIPPPISEAAEATAADAGDRSIAVLPFVNMSDDDANEYFSDGIAEELLNVLARIDNLRIPSRTTSFRFRDSELPLDKIAAQLGVRHVLEGSVRKAGKQVRITAQLIDASTDTRLWSDTYTRQLNDIFAIQSEIAEAITDALKLELGVVPARSGAGTANSEAYDHYLRGRFFWHQRRRKTFPDAERELRAAVTLDPGFGDAWAALADVYALQPSYVDSPASVAIPKARAALERALTINGESAQALATRGRLRFGYDWDYAAAEDDFQEALRLDPRYATAHQWYATLLSVLRRHEEAVAEARRAVALDPLAPILPNVLGWSLVKAGDIDAGIAAFEQGLQIDPEHWPALRGLWSANLVAGNYDAANAALARTKAAIGRDMPINQAVRDALAGLRPRAEVIELLNNPDAGCSPYFASGMLALLGAYDEAMDKIDVCIRDKAPYVTEINTLPYFEALRDLPRFRVQLARIQLPVE